MAEHIDPERPVGPTTGFHDGSSKEKEVSTAVRQDSHEGSHDTNEKTGGVATEHIVPEGGAIEEFDPYTPFNDLPEEKHWVVTARAIFVGCAAGALINSSNLYLGLKTGWTFTANLFGSIVGFAVLRAMSQYLPSTWWGLGGSFGPRENNIVQTAATAAGGMSNVFISALPAMYQLGLLDTPDKDYWRIVSLTAVGGFFGFFFATPLRKFFIIYVARELKLVFPTASATAMTIRAMHDAARGREVGKKKMRALSIAFVGAFVLRVVSQYAPGILWEWHPFAWFYIWGNYHNLAIAVENWGWFVQFTPAFIGSGMLVGVNPSLSFYGGSILAWGIIGPALVHNGVAFGKPASEDPHWEARISFASFKGSSVTKETPSPRYWMLWPGVLLMIAVSFTELFLQWKIIWYAGKAVYRGTARGLYSLAAKRGKDIKWLNKKPQEQQDLVIDPADPSELPKFWIWGPGLLISIIGICAVLSAEYGMPIGGSLLSVFLAFFFSFLAIQCTGVTDITPLTAASKASQIVLGGVTKGGKWEVKDAQRLNLLGGALANIGANQSTDLVADFRVGFLLRTPPNQQFIAQGIGTIVATFLAPKLFSLFMTAYPCVITRDDKCQFSYPSVAAWNAVAVAVTDPVFPIPPSSGYFAIAFAIFGAAMVLVRHFFWVGRLEWVRRYHPNMMCIGLAFVLPQTYYGLAMTIGAVISKVWAKKNPAGFDLLGFAIAAGLIAGEGIGGVLNAILQIADVAGDKYGSNVACPDFCDG